MPDPVIVPPSIGSNNPYFNGIKPGEGGINIVPPNQAQRAGPSPLSGNVQYGLDQKDYRFQLKTDADNAMLRAQDQGFGETLGIKFANMIPNILTGMVEMVGYGGALLTERGEERDYTNSLTELMKSWKNPAGEIYRENPNEVFDMGDSAWWIDNLGSVMESAAQFAIPAAGVAKGFGALAKLASVGRGTALVAKGAAQLGTAATLAYAEGAMSGYQVYEKAYNHQYKKKLAEGIDPSTAHTEATKIASEAASTTVQMNTIMNTMLNMTALTPLFRGSQNRAMDFIKDNAARIGNETGDQLRNRLIKKATESGILKNRSGITSYGSEALQEGLEEVNTQYAEAAGAKVGEGGKKDLFGALTDFGEALKSVSNEEGILNFALGAIGGIGQTVILDNVPFHRVQADGEAAVQGLKAPKETKLVSARTLTRDNTRQYFDNLVDAVVKDVEWHEDKMQQLKKAVDVKDDVGAEIIRKQMFDVLALNAVQMGTSEQWINTFEKILATENTVDNTGFQEQLDEINSQIQQAQDPQVQAELQQAKQELILQQADVQSEAVQRGLAENMNDNRYKERAQTAIDDLRYYSKLHADISGRYNSEEELSLGVPDYLFVQAANLYRQEKQLEEGLKEIQKVETEHTIAQAGLKSTAEMFNQVAAEFRDNMAIQDKIIERIHGDQIEFNKAIAAGDAKTIERILGKYKLLGYTGNDHVEKMQKMMDRQIENARKVRTEQMEKIDKSSGFALWKESNPDKTIDDYVKLLAKEHSARMNKAGLPEMRVHVEMLRATIAENTKKVSELLSDSGNLKKVLAKLKPELKKRTEEITKKLLEQEKQDELDKNAATVHTEMNKNALDAKERYLGKQIDAVNKQLIDADEQLRARKEKLRKINAVSHKIWNISAWAKIALLNSDIKALEKTRTQLIKQRDKLVEELEGIKTAQVTGNPPPPPPPTPDTDTGDTGEDDTGEGDTDTTEEAGITEAQKAALAKLNGLVARIKSELILKALQEAENLMKNGQDITVEEFMERPDVKQELLDGQALARTVRHAFIALQEYIATLPVVEKQDEDTDTGEDSDEDTDTDEETEGGTTDPVVTHDGQPHTGSGGADVKDNPRSIYDEQKRKNALQISNSTLKATDWKDGNNNYRISGSELNSNTHPSILDPSQLQPGTKIFLEEDKNYVGERRVYGQMNTVTKTSYSDYLDDKGKVKDKDNVPIKIMNEKGEIIGYLPTMEWLHERAKDADHSDPEGFRNIVAEITLPDGTVIDNLAIQTARLRNLRRLIIGNKVQMVVDKKGPGSVILNRVRSGSDGYYIEYGPALSTDPEKSLLPGNVQLGIVRSNSVYTGKGQSVAISNPELLQFYDEVPVALLPMANGELAIAPLSMAKLDDEPSLRTIERAITLHLDQRNNATEIAEFYKMSGYNLGAAADLQAFIKSQFTYLESFNATHTALNPEVAEQFLFNITPGKQGGPATILIGVRASGATPKVAKLVNGKLDTLFVDMMRAGLSERYKNVNYTTDRYKGINSTGEFTEYYFNNTGWTPIKYKNYNDYVKTYAQTTAFGRNKQGDRYVYSANPAISFDPDTLKIVIDSKTEIEPVNIVEPAKTQPVTSRKELALEQKIAEIEKRRNVELQEVRFIEEYSDSINNGSKTLEGELKRMIAVRKEEGQTNIDEEYLKTLIKERHRITRVLKSDINAKYDAEIAALKKATSTPATTVGTTVEALKAKMEKELEELATNAMADGSIWEPGHQEKIAAIREKYDKIIADLSPKPSAADVVEPLESTPDPVSNELSSEEAADLLDGLGFNMPVFRPSAPTSLKPTETMQPVSLELLQKIHNFTPSGDRNGLTPEQAFKQMLELNTPYIAEGHNPFLKCS